MPLQNRVTPWGAIESLPGRGTLTGNRGVLHDDHRRVVRPWQVRRWIACRLAFRGRRRTLMTPRRWTELFFLDEAAAFAAGHRPCAECRNADYRRFKALWPGAWDGMYAEDMDAVLHAERLEGRAKRTYDAPAATLPDGTYVALDGAAWLVHGATLLRWTDAAYGVRRRRPHTGALAVLTPPSIVAVFAAGYGPALHASASEEVDPERRTEHA